MNIQPPSAPQRPQEFTVNGDTRADPWFWLREPDDPATRKYLEEENAYTEAVMGSTQELQDLLYAEMRDRIKEDDATVPEKEGDYFYYVRFAEGQQYPIYCRKRQSLDAPEEVILDVNGLAEGADYMRVGSLENSPDHQWLAYSVDTDGSETFTIQVKNLATGELLPDTIPNSYYSLDWGNDNQTLYYDVLDENHRPVKIMKHRLGEDPSGDELVYQEEDARFFVGVGVPGRGRPFLCRSWQVGQWSVHIRRCQWQ
jgi:oligopeptidase B